MLNVFYYYSYLFYKKILKEDQPVLTTTFVLSFSISLLLNGIINIILAQFYCFYVGKWFMIGAFLLIFGGNYFYYHKKGMSKNIIWTKPKFFNNNRMTIIITIIFFAITTLFLVLDPIIVKFIFENNCAPLQLTNE